MWTFENLTSVCTYAYTTVCRNIQVLLRNLRNDFLAVTIN